MDNEIGGDEAMKNLDDLTDKLFGVKKANTEEITEDQQDDEAADD